MSYDTIDPNKTGVLFFDVLNAGFGTHDEKYERLKAPVVANCVRIRDEADARGIPVFYAKADHRPDGRDATILYNDYGRDGKPWEDPENDRSRPYRTNLAGNWGGEVIDELKPRPHDYVIPKHRKSAFFQTKLELSMRSRGIDTIILCGSATSGGVASTVFAAQDLDFNLIVVRDGCISARRDLHDMLMDGIFPGIGRVRSTDEVIQMIGKGAAA